MARVQRVLLLVHPDLHPRHGRRSAATEVDVWRTLRALGHTVEVAPVRDDFRELDRHLSRFRPHIAFNLLEEFRDEAVFDFHMVTLLEALGIPYTGCNPRGLIVSRHKLWTAILSRDVGLAGPRTVQVASGRRERVPFPAMVKLAREHASLGISQRNLVKNGKELGQSLARLRRRFDAEVIAQEFVAGREVTVSLWGNCKVESFPPRILHLPSSEAIATRRLKFGARPGRSQILRSSLLKEPHLRAALVKGSERFYSLLDLSGYARFDFRVNAKGEPFLIDVNANPCLARDEDFALSARAGGMAYRDLIERILKLGYRYQPRR